VLNPGFMIGRVARILLVARCARTMNVTIIIRMGGADRHGSGAYPAPISHIRDVGASLARFTSFHCKICVCKDQAIEVWRKNCAGKTRASANPARVAHLLRQTQSPRKICGERSDRHTQNSPQTTPLGTPRRPFTLYKGAEVALVLVSGFTVGMLHCGLTTVPSMALRHR